MSESVTVAGVTVDPGKKAYGAVTVQDLFAAFPNPPLIHVI